MILSISFSVCCSITFAYFRILTNSNEVAISHVFDMYFLVFAMAHNKYALFAYNMFLISLVIFLPSRLCLICVSSNYLTIGKILAENSRLSSLVIETVMAKRIDYNEYIFIVFHLIFL